MVNALREVKTAYRGKYAIGSFNINNLESFQAVLEASRETNQSVFMATSNKSIEYMGFDNIINLSQGLKRSKVILHLDHGDYKNAIRCINNDYHSVMFDGSRFPLKKNIRLTKKVVEHAHANNVIVEGEIGLLEKDNLTNPREAEVFAQQTGVDLLAVSVGNMHGYYKYMPVLDLKRLMDIKSLVNTPLVLHGATGLKDEDVKNAIKHGVVKVNINSDLNYGFTKKITDYLKRNSLNRLNKNTYDLREYLKLGREEYKKRVIEKIRLFHS